MIYFIDFENNKIMPVEEISVVHDTIHFKTGFKDNNKESVIYNTPANAVAMFDEITNTLVSNGTVAFIKDFGAITVRCTRGVSR